MFVICKLCGTSVFSFHRHDYRSCKCGEVSLDGGLDYHRVVANNLLNAIKAEGSIESNIKSIRETFEWTQSYAKNGSLLKTPVTSKLKKLTTDHIIGILLYFTQKLENNTEGSDLSVVSAKWRMTHEILLQELKYRKLK